MSLVFLGNNLTWKLILLFMLNAKPFCWNIIVKCNMCDKCNMIVIINQIVIKFNISRKNRVDKLCLQAYLPTSWCIFLWLALQHSQSSKNIKFALSKQYFNKELKDKFVFRMKINIIVLISFILVVIASHVQSTQKSYFHRKITGVSPYITCNYLTTYNM